MLKKHFIGFAVLDTDIERDVACHFWYQQCRTRHICARNAQAIDERDAVVSLKGGIAFRFTVACIATLYLAVVTVTVDDIGGLQLQSADQQQHECTDMVFHG